MDVNDLSKTLVCLGFLKVLSSFFVLSKEFLICGATAAIYTKDEAKGGAAQVQKLDVNPPPHQRPSKNSHDASPDLGSFIVDSHYSSDYDAVDQADCASGKLEQLAFIACHADHHS